MKTTTEVDRKALPARLCAVAGSRHLRGDRRSVVVGQAPVVDHLQRRRQGLRR